LTHPHPGPLLEGEGVINFSPFKGEISEGDGFSMQGQTNKVLLRSHLQRVLRHTMTDAERKLWRALRSKQMQGLKFRRQHPFENYILDFVCLEEKIVIELDGGQHQESKIEDDARTSSLEKAGFHVLRFWNHEVLQQPAAVAERIWQEVLKRKELSRF
jgi:very-short-patch-repair endonuclease